MKPSSEALSQSISAANTENTDPTGCDEQQGGKAKDEPDETVRTQTQP